MDEQRLVEAEIFKIKERKEVNENTNKRLIQNASISATTSLKLRAINMQISYERALRPILALEVSFKRISSLVEHK